MKTFMANAQNVDRKWYVVDAAGKPVGRIASQVASVLRGKNKPTFTPHTDCGDFVIIINSDKAIVTGNKLTDKIKYHHTLYMGGLKEIKYGKLMKEKSDKALWLAVKGMMPKNSLGRKMLKKLHIYKDGEHGHQAQQPQALQLVEKRYN